MLRIPNSPPSGPGNIMLCYHLELRRTHVTSFGKQERSVTSSTRYLITGVVPRHSVNML